MNKRHRNRKKHDSFWLIYTIVVAVLLIGIAAGLVLFYDFIDAFEASQPQSPADAAKNYALKLTEADVTEMLNVEADKLTWGSDESRSRAVQDYVDSFKEGSLFCRRNGGTDDSPVYSVLAAKREICRIELKKAPIGRYGFDAWTVTDRYVSFEGFTNYTVTVPNGTVLTVNGKVLDDSYVTERGAPYSTSPIEAGAAELPVGVTYETDLFDVLPEITAVYNGHSLVLKSDGTSYSAEYPAALLYSADIKVPAGSLVTVRGVNLAEHVTKASESAFGGLIAEGLTVPSFDIYSLDGLYVPLADVTVKLDGALLDFTETLTDNVQSISVDIGGVTDSEVSSFADSFTRAYFHYTSNGYRNTAENLAAALAYVKSGTELYTRIRDSKVGYDYVTPVTSQVYNRLEVVRMYRLEDSSYVVKLAFDVDHQIYSEHRSYKGEISLHIVEAGGYKIANMVIENE